MSLKRTSIYRTAILDVAEGHARHLWLTALTVGALFLGYYFFSEVWPALLHAGSG